MNSTGLKELLEAFVAKDCKESEYSSELDALLSDTAKTGAVKYSWLLLKPLLKFRLESVLKSDSLTGNPGDDKELPEQLSHRLDTFDNPPFTIQRLCELVMYPRQHYKSRAKYMRAMEKNLMIVSTHDPDCAWIKTPRLTQAALPGIPNHSHTSNHHTTGVSDTPDHITSSAAPAVESAASADQDMTHSSRDHDITPPLLDQTRTHPREVTHPSQERVAQNQNDPGVRHPSVDQEVTHPSADQEVTHPSADQEVTHPSVDREVTHPSADREGTHPSADQEGTHPSADQEGTQPSQEMAHPSDNHEVTWPSQEATRPSVFPSDHEPSQEVVWPTDDHEVICPSQEVMRTSQDYHSSLGLPRKRNSSLRDSLDGGRGIAADMCLVLQEADSTTIEHSHLPSQSNQEVVSAGNLEQESNGIKVVDGANMWGRREEAVHMEESEKTLGGIDGMKRVRYLDAVEMRKDGETNEGGVADVSSVCKDLGGKDELNVVQGGIEEVGVAEVEVRKNELYKEAATGQVELEAQTNNQLQPDGVEKS